MSVYTTSAQVYDLLYREKDYAGEAARIRELVTEHAPDAKTLLDVACGTGAHLAYLQQDFRCAGLDLSPDLLKIARERLPSMPFYEGNMRTFDLAKTFDVVTCLFSAIGYMTTVDDLQRAFAQMARHVAPGGVLLVEPWFSPEQFINGRMFVMTIDEPEIKLTRMTHSQAVNGISVLNMHHLLGIAGEGVQHYLETHEMGLFTPQQYTEAATRAGLRVLYDEDGLTGRGLVIGLAPASAAQ